VTRILSRETLQSSHFNVSLGKPAPDFTLPDPEGRYISLREYLGRKVILVFLRQYA